MTINLFASAGSTNSLMGTSDISLSEVLIFPQNKIQLTTKVVSVSNGCEHMDAFENYCSCDVTAAKPKHLGNLRLWFRLTCELDVLKLYINNIEQWWTQSDFQNNVWMNDITTQDPALTQNEQQQQKNTSTELIDYNRAIGQTTTSKTLITMTIACLKLNSNVSEISSNSIDLYLIECSFIGNRRLKTAPIPLKMNELSFHFTKQFPCNEHSVQRLKSILADPEHSIKLVLVKTRPISDEPDAKIESLEIGFGLLHLSKFIHDWNDANEISSHTFDVNILSKKPPYQSIGCLSISIEDISSLKLLQQQQQTTNDK